MVRYPFCLQGKYKLYAVLRIRLPEDGQEEGIAAPGMGVEQMLFFRHQAFGAEVLHNRFVLPLEYRTGDIDEPPAGFKVLRRVQADEALLPVKGFKVFGPKEPGLLGASGPGA